MSTSLVRGHMHVCEGPARRSARPKRWPGHILIIQYNNRKGLPVVIRRNLTAIRQPGTQHTQYGCRLRRLAVWGIAGTRCDAVLWTFFWELRKLPGSLAGISSRQQQLRCGGRSTVCTTCCRVALLPHQRGVGHGSWQAGLASCRSGFTHAGACI